MGINIDHKSLIGWMTLFWHWNIGSFGAQIFEPLLATLSGTTGEEHIS